MRPLETLVTAKRLAPGRLSFDLLGAFSIWDGQHIRQSRRHRVKRHTSFGASSLSDVVDSSSDVPATAKSLVTRVAGSDILRFF